jgi:hypothetical protein
MKKFTWMFSLFAAVLMCVSSVVAQEDEMNAGFGWQSNFRDMLEEGKAAMYDDEQAKIAGYAYTPTEEVILEDAIKYALSDEQGDRACECLKIAVELEYNAYSVLKMIYGIGGDLEIDSVCACATEAGVTKAIIADAATDAVTLLDEPVYDINEISRSQCLTGLAYQTDAGERGKDPKEDPASKITTD